MQDLREKTAYLRGLIEGADFPKDEKERIIWGGLLDFCDVVADELSELTDSQTEVEDYLEAIDEDLGSLEKYFYHNEEDEDVDVVFSKDDHQAVMELTCPHCKEEIYFEDQTGDYEVICPECGKVVWNSSIMENTSNAKSDMI